MIVITTEDILVDPQQGLCPISKTRGKRVGTATLKCLISTSLKAVQPTQYYFCREPDCPIVYFSADGAQVFTTSEIRERVYQKEPNSDDVLVCYCFQYTLDDIRDSATRAETNPIVDAINQGIQLGQCACDWRNPQGDCCLGNVRTILRNVIIR